jgi:hypothetical protein
MCRVPWRPSLGLAGASIAGGGKIDLLESGPMPERIFIIEFPNADAARRWDRSDEYQAVLKIRLSASHGRVFLIEGTGNFRGTPRGRFGCGIGSALRCSVSGCRVTRGKDSSLVHGYRAL